VGLLAMIPNLMPVIMMLGFMGWSGTPLDPFTLIIGCIAIGLAVDDTIHFMHNYQRYFSICGDVRTAIFQTLQTTGRAMLFTTLVLTAGFFVYLLSAIKSLANFGFLIGFGLIVAFLADVLLVPALLTVIRGPGGRGGTRAAGGPEESAAV
jgi:predicted RND superfamily exporter protein